MLFPGNRGHWLPGSSFLTLPSNPLLSLPPFLPPNLKLCCHPLSQVIEECHCRLPCSKVRGQRSLRADIPLVNSPTLYTTPPFLVRHPIPLSPSLIVYTSITCHQAPLTVPPHPSPLHISTRSTLHSPLSNRPRAKAPTRITPFSFPGSDTTEERGREGGRMRGCMWLEYHSTINTAQFIQETPPGHCLATAWPLPGWAV